jgi:hypothetical protein
MSHAFALFRASDAQTFLRRVLTLDAVTSGAMSSLPQRIDDRGWTRSGSRSWRSG